MVEYLKQQQQKNYFNQIPLNNAFKIRHIDAN